MSFDEEFIGELNLLLKLLLGEAYIWNCATLSAFQGNHLYSALLTYILADLSNEKFKLAWIGADLDNVASQKESLGRDLVISPISLLLEFWR